MAQREERARQPPCQMDSDPRPYARANVGRSAASGVGARHSAPPRSHAPESYDEYARYPRGGEGRRNDFVREGPSNGGGQGQRQGEGEGGGRGAPPRWPRWTPANQTNNDDDDCSSSSSDDEPEFRDMHIVIDRNRIRNAKGAKIVTGQRVKRDLSVTITNNVIGG